MRNKIIHLLNKPITIKWMMNLYRPLRAAGIRVNYIANDYRQIDVSLKLKLSNKNIHGVHFGGSLFAMTDPFFVMMISYHLGTDYIVWDKAADIQFIKPGRGTVRASFKLSSEQIEDLFRHTSEGQRYMPQYTVHIVDEHNDVVAHVRKTIYVRKKCIKAL
ncbi:DUF4442 domain-containing protein [Gynuella sp.]|uniref:DUF4442 domain-containing protein n=1 Tax=Gynuella sp. TaxID=2969146 RepID=UPI003D0A220B